MNLELDNLQPQYQGYVNTPLLWNEHSVLGLQQLDLPRLDITVINENIPKNLLLGKRVERFVHAELCQHKNIQIVLENVQVQKGKITIGEIDCLLKQNNTPIHLEIVYKFYLYDPSVGIKEIEHWIGPNRNDSLVKKLRKLKDKQLPLINNKHTKPLLDTFGYSPEDIQQKVCFKAQLFTPYKKALPNFNLLNKACLTGFYIHVVELAQFSKCKFYIPTKANWLLEVQTQVDWNTYQSFHEEVMLKINNKTAPLCWIKFPNGVLQKFFVVWWDEKS